MLLKASNENAVAMVICSNEYDSTYSTTGNAPYIEIAYHTSSDWMDEKIFTIYNKGTNNYLSVADSYDYEKQNIIVHNTYTSEDARVYVGAEVSQLKEQSALELLNSGQQFKMRYNTQLQTYTIAPISSMNGSVKSRVVDVLYKKVNGERVIEPGCNVDIYSVYNKIDTSISETDKKVQNFIFTPCGYGYYKIELKYFPNYVLTANAGNGTNSDNAYTSVGNVYIDIYDSLDSQKWLLTEQTTTEAIEDYYSAMSFRYPVSSSYKGISSDFGLRDHNPADHGGIDIYTDNNKTTVYSAFAGTIVEIGYEDDMKGNYVIIRASNSSYHVYGNENQKLHLVYMHLDEIFEGIAVGNTVTTSTAIGKTGDTGNTTGIHLHFGIIDDVQYGSSGKIKTSAEYTIDPMYFFDDYGLYSVSTN